MVPTGQRSLVWGFAMLGGISAVLIGSALFSEHVLGMAPCGLCLRQRLGHYLVMPAAFAGALALSRRSGGAKPAGLLMALVVLGGFVFSLYWAGFHVGVESGWWAGLASCDAGVDTSALSFEALLATPLVACDQPTIIFRWLFGGLSMALVHTLVLLPASALAAWQLWRMTRLRRAGV